MNQFKLLFRQKFLSPIQEFIHDSRAVGITLMVCTFISLFLSNSSIGQSYLQFWNMELLLPISKIHLPHSFVHFINDGLMTIFFLLVGMEIKREIIEGELSSVKRAVLPVIAAIGGMIVPALLYYFINYKAAGHTQGWGVPMATDIAFSLGILSLLGNRIPPSLKIFLTALAIIDDLGAILAIAIFYTDTIHWSFLIAGGIIFIGLLLLNKLRVYNLYFYIIPGIALWYCFFNSGVHATFAGVLLAMAMPMCKVCNLEYKLHDPVSFIILPLFALANTAIIFPEETLSNLHNPINYGILTGLIVGKPLGILAVSFIAVKLRWASLPAKTNWRCMTGVGMLAGIGFTMSIFISLLAFKYADLQNIAKISVLMASLVSGFIGYIFLRQIKKKKALVPAN